MHPFVGNAGSAKTAIVMQPLLFSVCVCSLVCTHEMFFLFFYGRHFFWRARELGKGRERKGKNKEE